MISIALAQSRWQFRLLRQQCRWQFQSHFGKDASSCRPLSSCRPASLISASYQPRYCTGYSLSESVVKSGNGLFWQRNACSLGSIESIHLSDDPELPHIVTASPDAKAHSPEGDVFAPDDWILLRDLEQDKWQSSEPKMLQLRAKGIIHSHHGKLPHSEIIGKRPWSTVKTHRNKKYTITRPSLEEHIVFFPYRLVTPIYPRYARQIVALLDIHPPISPALKPIRVFEAGTGTGGVTLHLAQLLAATGVNDAKLHSIDCNKRHLQRAKEVVQSYRRGIYTERCVFGVASSPLEYFERCNLTEAFDSAVLDMPDVHKHLSSVFAALKHGANFVVFCPSVTQVITCVHMIERAHSQAESIQAENINHSTNTESNDTSNFHDNSHDEDITDIHKDECNNVHKDVSLETASINVPIDSIQGRFKSQLPKFHIMNTYELSDYSLREWDVRSASVRASSEQVTVCRPRVGVRVRGGGFLLHLVKP